MPYSKEHLETLYKLNPYAQYTKQFEGFKDYVYQGAYENEPTIGYGFNLNSPMFKGLSTGYILKNAEELFIKAYLSARFDAAKYVGYDTFNKLSPERQAVLIDMAYNLGPTRLAKFIELNKAIQKNDFNTAAKEMINSKWYRQVGNRSKKLVQVMRTNKWD